jgi:hypothetical protein
VAEIEEVRAAPDASVITCGGRAKRRQLGARGGHRTGRCPQPLRSLLWLSQYGRSCPPLRPQGKGQRIKEGHRADPHRWDGRRPRRIEEGKGVGGGADGRRLRGGGTEVLGFEDAIIRSKHDFNHLIDDGWSKIDGPVRLKPAQFCFEA